MSEPIDCDWIYGKRQIGDLPMVKVDRCGEEASTPVFTNGGYYCPRHLAQMRQWFEDNPDA